MIIRKKHSKNFTVLPNSIYDRGELSLEAIGLLCFLVSRPKDWDIRHDSLRRKFCISRERLGRIFRELIGAGYLQREGEQPRDDLKRFSVYGYIVRDEPLKTRADVAAPCAANRGRESDRENKKEDNKNSENKISDYKSTVLRAKTAGHQDSYSEFGRRAIAAGMRHVFVGSEPHQAWLAIRGPDGMPLRDCATIDGVVRQIVWLPSVYPPRDTR